MPTPILDVPALLERARDVLHQAFGHREFLPGQEEALQRVLSREDLTVVMPTGAGKSLCFQLPALVQGGLTLVVSPLIALMKDQVEGLKRKGIAADLVNSTIPAAEQWRRLDAAALGHTRLLYVAPERLGAPSFLRAMERADLRMVAIDEAHCISQWGHDFRPAYLGIQTFLDRAAKGPLGRPQVLALTATATPRVREDIAQQLAIDPTRLLITGFRRPNLRLLARRCDRKPERLDQVLSIARGVGGSGIVYCGTRKDVEEVSLTLNQEGVHAVAYHAGLPDEERASVQDAFRTGAAPVIVATNAFGMGVDKPDIRFVIHHSLPGSIEAYYQEAGRAGRDGATAYCVLVHGSSDRYLHEFFVDGSWPPDAVVDSVFQALRGRRDEVIEISVHDLAAAAGVPENQCSGALRMLEDAELIARLDNRDNPAQVRLSQPTTSVSTAVLDARRRPLLEWLAVRCGASDTAFAAAKPSLASADLGLSRDAFLAALRELQESGLATVRAPFRGRGIVVTGRGLAPAEVRAKLGPQLAAASLRRQRARERVDRMVHYANARRCRHRFLLEYFGDEADFSCTACDNCRDWEPKGAAPRQASPAGARVTRSPKQRRMTSVDLDEVRASVLDAAAIVDRRFGVGVLALVLRGSRSKKVLGAGLDSCPAYGSLARLASAQVDEVIAAVQGEGLFETTDGPYPVVLLTEEGRLRRESAGSG